MPLFQTSGLPLEEENNYFLSQYLRGKTPLDRVVPYGPNFPSVPSQPATGWNPARFASLLQRVLPTAGCNASAE